MKEGLFLIPKTRVILDGESEVQVIESDVKINEVDTALAKERVNIEENDDNDKILFDSEVDNN